MYSARVLDALLVVGFRLGLRRCRKLQDFRRLPRDKARKQDMAAVGEFQAVMMGHLVGLVDLPEDSGRVLAGDNGDDGVGVVELDRGVKRDLGSRLDAYGALRVGNAGEPSRAGAEVGGDELIVKRRIAGFHVRGK